MSSENQRNKQLVWQFWQSLHAAGAGDVGEVVGRHVAKDSQWFGPAPINQLQGSDSFEADYWRPLLHSFPDLKRHCHIFIGGQSSGCVDGMNDGRLWVGGTGTFDATFENDYLTIPASHDTVAIRWGEFCRVDRGRIVATYFLLDLVDLMQQAGHDVLPPSHGVDGVYPPPLAGDGVRLELPDTQTSGDTLTHIRRFIFDALNRYDQSQLSSMGIADFFHRDIRWYGPGGIGACFGLSDFERNHQRHWLHAFPDRRVQDLTALIAEGPYSGGPGWAGVLATHTGDYLDCPATNRGIEFNGIDFWKKEHDKYTENWVFVDMIHLYRQFGIDLFDRLPAA